MDIVEKGISHLVFYESLPMLLCSLYLVPESFDTQYSLTSTYSKCFPTL